MFKRNLLKNLILKGQFIRLFKNKYMHNRVKVYKLPQIHYKIVHKVKSNNILYNYLKYIMNNSIRIHKIFIIISKLYMPFNLEMVLFIKGKMFNLVNKFEFFSINILLNNIVSQLLDILSLEI